MPDSDKTLKIQIALELLGKGDIEGAKEALSGLKKETGEMTQSLPEGWQGMEKYKTLLNQAGTEAEGAGHHLHELRALMRGGGPEAAELGHLLHFAFNPAMLGGAALAAGMEGYFHWLEKCQERQREMTEGLTKHNEFLRESVKLMGNLYEDANKVQDAIAKAASAQNSLTEQFKVFEDRARVFNQADTDALDLRIDKRKALNGILGEELKMLEAMGRITPQQGEQDKIRLEHAQKVQEIKDKVTKAESDYTSAESDRDQQIKMAGGRSAASPESLGAATEAVANAEAALKQARHDAQQGAADDLRQIDQQIDKYRQDKRKHPLRMNEDQDAIDQLRDQRNETIRRRDAAQKSLPDLVDQAAKATQHLADLQSLHDKFQALDSSVSLLHQKFLDAQASAGPALQSENQRAAIEAVTSALKAGLKPGDIFNQGVNALDILDKMKANTGYTPTQVMQFGNKQDKAYVQGLYQQVEALENLETSTGNNGQAFVGAINRIVMAQGTHAAAITNYVLNLERRLENLTEQFNHGRSIQGGQG